jgi:hypothetical protein
MFTKLEHAVPAFPAPPVYALTYCGGIVFCASVVEASCDDVDDPVLAPTCEAEGLNSRHVSVSRSGCKRVVVSDFAPFAFT